MNHPRARCRHHRVLPVVALLAALSLAGCGAAVQPASLRAGVTEAQLAADPRSTSTFVTGERACPAHLFRETEIGEHVFRDVRLQVVDAPAGQGAGALGADHLLRQRIWISPGTGRVFIARRSIEPSR